MERGKITDYWMMSMSTKFLLQVWNIFEKVVPHIQKQLLRLEKDMFQHERRIQSFNKKEYIVHVYGLNRVRGKWIFNVKRTRLKIECCKHISQLDVIFNIILSFSKITLFVKTIFLHHNKKNQCTTKLSKRFMPYLFTCKRTV